MIYTSSEEVVKDSEMTQIQNKNLYLLSTTEAINVIISQITVYQFIRIRRNWGQKRNY